MSVRRLFHFFCKLTDILADKHTDDACANNGPSCMEGAWVLVRTIVETENAVLSDVKSINRFHNMEQRYILSRHAKSESSAWAFVRNEQAFLRKILKDFREEMMRNPKRCGKLSDGGEILVRPAGDKQHGLEGIFASSTEEQAHGFPEQAIAIRKLCDNQSPLNPSPTDPGQV